MNLLGIDLGQLFNPLFILTGLLLVTYFWLVGSCTKVYLKKFRFGSITLGFLVTILLFGIMFISFRFAKQDYKEMFIAFMTLTTGFSIYAVIKNRVKVDVRKLKILGISSLITLLVTIVLSNWYQAVNPNHDYWLYGKFITNGSNFKGDIVSSSNIYILSNFYDFVGSFIGLINGPIKGFVGNLDHTGNVFEQIIYVVQVPMAIVLTCIVMDIAYHVTTKKKLLLISLIAIQCILPFQTGVLGPFMLFIPFTMLLLDVRDNKVDANMTMLYIIPFVFFVSSISFLIPFVALFMFISQGKLRLVDFATYGLGLTAFVLSGKNDLGQMDVDFEVLALLIGVTALFALRKPLWVLWTLTQKFMDKNLLTTNVIIIIFVLLYVFTTPIPASIGIATLLSILVGRGIFSLVSLFVFLNWAKTNKNVRNYLIAAIIFVNPIINIAYSVFNIMDRIPVIYHRIGNIILIGEMYMNIGSAILFVLFAIQVLKKINRGGRSNDKLHSSTSK